jgi:hypothetical protein
LINFDFDGGNAGGDGAAVNVTLIYHQQQTQCSFTLDKRLIKSLKVTLRASGGLPP